MELHFGWPADPINPRWCGSTNSPSDLKVSRAIDLLRNRKCLNNSDRAISLWSSSSICFISKFGMWRPLLLDRPNQTSFLFSRNISAVIPEAIEGLALYWSPLSLYQSYRGYLSRMRSGCWSCTNIYEQPTDVVFLYSRCAFGNW